MKTTLVITPLERGTEITFLQDGKTKSFEELDEPTRRMFLHRLPELTAFLKREHGKLIT